MSAPRPLSLAAAALAAGLGLASPTPAPAAQSSGANTVLVGFLEAGGGAVFAYEDAQRGVIELRVRKPGDASGDSLALEPSPGQTWEEAKGDPRIGAWLAAHPVLAPVPGPESPRGDAKVVTSLVDVHDKPGHNPLDDGPMNYQAGDLVVAVTDARGFHRIAAVPFETAAPRGAALQGLDQTRAGWSPDGGWVAVAGHVRTEYPAPHWDRLIPVAVVGEVRGPEAPGGGATATPSSQGATPGRSSWFGCDASAGGAGSLAGAALAALAAAFPRRVRRARPGQSSERTRTLRPSKRSTFSPQPHPRQ
ncbi:hypothetical protein L6R50_02245 [Myxococcota bacterium]|nr:hypothetical protein [Myxococcota bacterium]